MLVVITDCVSRFANLLKSLKPLYLFLVRVPRVRVTTGALCLQCLKNE